MFSGSTLTVSYKPLESFLITVAAPTFPLGVSKAIFDTPVVVTLALLTYVLPGNRSISEVAFS